MRPATSATPLIAIRAVAVDLETTGVDATKAFIVQIGAISIARGKLVADARLDMLVDPGVPIPAASSRIHGLTDSQLSGAPKFAAAWARFQDFAADSILIGHSIGFDLAVLERECGRAGLPWARPRALCVRLLARLANPHLADHSLDTVASWLGLEITGRHTGLGDATAAAEIFLCLLPELRKRGIRTLGEAEMACLTLSRDLEALHRAGWAEPVSRPDVPAFRPIDLYAFQHRAAGLMSSPPVVVTPSDSIRQVVDSMVARKISSVLVADVGGPGAPVAEYGIVTERDIMRRIALDGEDALCVPVGTIASRPLASVQATDFAYRAIGRMNRLDIRHLVVLDDLGMLVGVLSSRDLMKLRAAAAINLDDAIEHAGDAAELAAAWAGLPGIGRSLLAEEVGAPVVAEIISDELRALTRRAAMLAELSMKEDGLGGPPCAYAVLVLGSGGRGESLLGPDQDNAVVFEHGVPEGPEDRWFQALGEKLAATLDAVGVPYCRGGVMASNAAFRGSLETWKSRIEQWVMRSRPDDLLNVDIFYDMKSVHGDILLAESLYAYAYSRGQAEPAFTKILGEQIVSANPLTLFGGLQLQSGRFDIKKHGLFPIVAAARTLAIRHDVRAMSTRDRLDALSLLGLGGEEDLRMMLDGHGFLLGVMLRQQIRDVYAGIAVSNGIEFAKLPRDEQAELKVLIKKLQGIPGLVRDLMFV